MLSLAVVLAVLGGGVAVVALLTQRAVDRRTEHDSTWREGVTAASVAQRIGIRTPKSATGERAGVRDNSRYTVALITFTVPTRDAQSYLARLVPEDTDMVTPVAPGDTPPPAPDASFRKLGLPDPATAEPDSGVRTANLCPDANSKEAAHLKHCVDVYQGPVAGGGDARTRLYFRATVAGQ